ncbi:MAG: DUF1749 domain-containing protein [Candidatus Moranbacteria bacterium]|nr:DUF1749 domain-containing protein [Candidatus Moranbacteria bacterium]
MLNYPIAQVETKDNLWLHGLYLSPPKSKAIFINIHGTGSNFYEEDFIEIFAKRFSKMGIALLATNNRGAGIYDAYQKIGAAVEKFEDCLIDIDAWIEFALNKGYKKNFLSGHSLGTEKIVYYMSNGKYRDKITSLVLLAPSDSFGSHRLLDGNKNPRSLHVAKLLKQADNLMKKGRGDTFLAKDAYGSREGIMPKSAASFLDFLGLKSELSNVLPFATKKLEAFSKIKIPILAVIGDQKEYTAISILDALKLMEQENKRTQTFQIKNCDHDFQGKEKELANIVSKFLKKV